MEPDYTKKETLEYYYNQCQYSIKLVAMMCECHPKTIRKWLEKHGIKVRDSKESRAIETRTKAKVNSAPERLSTAVGDFALSFERLCRVIRLGIWAVLENNGLKDAWHCTDILVGDLIAFPLQSILRALINQTRKCSTEDNAILGIIFKRIISISETRNSVLHAAWYIDYKSRTDLLTDTFTSYRPGYSKTGAKPTPSRISITQIQDAAAESRIITDFVDCINSCIHKSKPFTEYLHLHENKLAYIDKTNKRA